MTKDAPAQGARSRSGAVVAAALIDAASVISFAAAGRASHDSDVWAGLFTTAWPFLTALIVGWVVARGWRAPFAPVRTGVTVWLVTVIGGMLLRAASGQGTAFAFILVATLVLGALVVGWRGIAFLIARRLGRS